jgi:hypothetical protein
VKPDTWKNVASGGIAGAVVGATVAATTSAAIKDRQETQIRHVEPTKAVDDLADEDIFDPDFFKKKGNGASRSTSKQVEKPQDHTAENFDHFVEVFEERYNEKPVSQADFFTPDILKDHCGGQSPKIDPNIGADIHVYQAHDPELSGTPKGPPYPPAYAFTASKDIPDSSYMSAPWPVPVLNLIQPTPPGSVRAPSAPPSPAIVPQDVAPGDVEERSDRRQSRPTTKVTWGEDQLHHYEVETPDSYREAYITDRDVKRDEPKPSDYEIVVEGDSPNSGTRRTTYKPEQDRSATPEKDTSRAKKKVYESQSPVVTPVVVQPEDDKSRKNDVYQAPFYETVSDLSQPHGFVEGEVGEDSTREKKFAMPGGFDDEPLPEEELEQAKESAWEAPLSKKEKKKREKEAKRQSVDSSPASEVPSPIIEKEAAWEPPLSKKELKKREKESKRQSIDSSASPDLSSSVGFEKPAEIEITKSKKDKKGKKSKSSSRDQSPTTAGAEEPSYAKYEDWDAPKTSKDKKDKKARGSSTDRDLKDFESSVPEEEFQQFQTLKNQSEGGVDVSSSKPSSSIMPAVVAAGGFAGIVATAAAKQGRDPKPSESSSSRDPHVPEAPSSQYIPGGFSAEPEERKPYSSQNGNRRASRPEPEKVIPSTAFHDVEELEDAKTPKKKEKRRSGRFSSPAPGSPLRTELGYEEDYMSQKPQPEARQLVMEPTYAAGVPLPDASFDEVDDLRSSSYLTSTPSTRDATADGFDQPRKSKSKNSERYEPASNGADAIIAEAYDEYEHGDRKRSTGSEIRDYDSARSEDDDAKKRSKHRRRESEKGDDDARSVVSEDRYDENGEKKKRHHRRRESERDDDTRSIASEDRYDENGERRRRHHRRRESDRDDDTRSVVSEDRYDENGDRKKRHHRRHGSEANGSPERYARSTAASEPGDLYDRDRKSSKHRSKRDSDIFDDAASVASSPARYDEPSSKTSKEKEKKSGGLFGLFGGRKSTESLQETSSKSKSKDSRDKDELDDDRKHRKKKHRSSTYGSDDDDARSTTSSNRRHKSRSRDDIGMDTRYQASSKVRKHDPLCLAPATPLQDERGLTID